MCLFLLYNELFMSGLYKTLKRNGKYVQGKQNGVPKLFFFSFFSNTFASDVLAFENASLVQQYSHCKVIFGSLINLNLLSLSPSGHFYMACHGVMKPYLHAQHNPLFSISPVLSPSWETNISTFSVRYRKICSKYTSYFPTYCNKQYNRWQMPQWRKQI